MIIGMFRLYMKKILIESVKKGDVLAMDIISGNGLTALKKGVTLDENIIERIKRLTLIDSGFEGNYIFIEENYTGNEEDMEKELSMLAKRFENIDGDGFMRGIKEIIKSAILKNYGRN